MTSKEQARALCQQYLTSVAVNSTDGIAKHEQIRLNQQAATKLVTDIIAALDAAEKRGACKRYSEPHTIPHDFIRADARRKMGEEIEVAIVELVSPFNPYLDDFTRTIRAIVRKAAKGGLDDN